MLGKGGGCWLPAFSLFQLCFLKASSLGWTNDCLVRGYASMEIKPQY